VIPLLARDDLGNVPLRHLQKLSTRISGQLLDALLHHDLDASVRRELPRTLERCPGAEVLPRLSIAFEDDDPIVRLRAAQTAVRFIARAPMLALPRERVHAWVEGALDTSDQALASAFEGCDAESVRSVFGPAPGAGLRPPRVELAFTLLALGHPLDVVQASVHGVEGGATRLRGTALEYLETTLSAPLFARFFALLKRGDEAPPAPRADRRRDDVAAELLETSRAIAARRLMEDA